jgi:isoquinoline 1-oxidoreductase beta subunit
VAQVAEVEVSKSGEVRVHRVVCAVDCGTAINPDTVRAQMEGGIVFGIGGALWGEITLKNGRVEQSNFNNYRVLRMNETPAIEVHLVRNNEANAIFAATGKRIRQLPLQKALQGSA